MVYTMTPVLLELLLLSIIEKEDTYGYLIGQQLKTVSDLKDSSLYPVLKRLADQNLVEIYDMQYQGRNRKYYHLTEEGKERFELLKIEWNAYTKKLDEILGIADRNQKEGKESI